MKIATVKVKYDKGYAIETYHLEKDGTIYQEVERFNKNGKPFGNKRFDRKKKLTSWKLDIFDLFLARTQLETGKQRFEIINGSNT